MTSAEKVTAIHGARRSIEEIEVSRLSIDSEVQRDLIPARVRALANHMDLDAIGVLTVSRRFSGQMVVLDGQTRMMALKSLGLDEWAVTCNVYHGLTRAQEAHLFRVLNNTRKPTAFDDFTKGVVAGDPLCVAITELADKHGLRISKTTADSNLACVTALQEAYRMDDGISLDNALAVAVSAWGHRAEAMHADIVRGLSLVFNAYRREVEMRTLIKKLANYPGGAAGLLGQARAIRQYRTASISRLVAATVVEIYNRGKRGNALPDM